MNPGQASRTGSGGNHSAKNKMSGSRRQPASENAQAGLSVPIVPCLLALIAILGLFGLITDRTLAIEITNWSSASNLSSMPGHSRYATSARNPVTGDLFVAWMNEVAGERGEILSRRLEQAYQSWLPSLNSPATNLSMSEWHDGGPTLFFNRHGEGLLLWTRRYSASQGAPADGTDLLWRSWDGVGWSDETVLFHSNTYLPSTYGYGLIPIETPESVLLFVTWETDYRTMEYRDGIWSDPSPWNHLDVGLAHVLRDEKGHLHAAAYGANSSQEGWDQWFRDAYYLTYDGANWSTPLNLSSTDGVVRDMGMALDSQGRLHFLWSDPDSPYSSESLKSAIWERVYENGAWKPNAEVTIHNDDQAINGFSLATDTSGTFQLAWSEGILVDGIHTNLGIHYQTGDGTHWELEEEVFTSDAESRYPVLAVSDDKAFIIWLEGPLLDRDVYFSRQITAGPCQSLTEVSIQGPSTASIGQTHLFTATSGPLTATWPVTYTWQATQQQALIHSSGFIDTAGFSWSLTGTKAVTVTAMNCGEAVSATHTIELRALERVFLPLITKQ